MASHEGIRAALFFLRRTVVVQPEYAKHVVLYVPGSKPEVTAIHRSEFPPHAGELLRGIGMRVLHCKAFRITLIVGKNSAKPGAVLFHAQVRIGQYIRKEFGLRKALASETFKMGLQIP